MNFRELNEDAHVHIDNFATGARETLKDLGGLAKNALGKFKTAKQQVQADNKAAAKKQKREDAKNAANTAEADKQKKDQLLMKAGPKTAATTAAGLILDRTPEAQDLPELEDLDAQHFSYLLDATDQLEKRLSTFSKGLTRAFRTAQFINANDRKEVHERLGDQDDRIVEAAEGMLMQDKYGERDAWMKALLSEDPEEGYKALMNLIGRISAANAKKNAAQNKKVYAEGLNLVNLIGAWRQIIEMRIGLFRQALDELSKKPVMSESLLKRVGKLAKRL